MLRLRPDVKVLHGGHRYVIKTVVDEVWAYCLDQEGTNHKLLKIAELKPDDAGESKPKLEEVVAMSATRLAIGDARAELIRGLMKMGNRTRADVQAVATKAEVNTATIYRWIERWESAGSSLALVPFKRGRVLETRMISKEAEELIAQMIETQFLTSQKITAAKFIEKVRKACAKIGVTAPHDNTIRMRLARIPGVIRATRRGSRRDQEKFTATPGTNPQGAFAQSDYQIDHTELPIIIVDDKHRRSIRRAWITVVIDVKTRVIAGFYLSLDPPSTQSVAMALYYAMAPKEEFLERLGVQAEWPVWGKPNTLHADNALEFRGNGLSHGVRKHDIDLQWRPVEQPRYGAHIERLIGTLGIELTSWSGATFSGPNQKREYDAEGMAIYTMEEAERCIAIWATKIYHHSRHEGLEKRTPMGVFKEELIGDHENPGIGLPDRPTDPNRMIIDFLRVEMRAITPSGAVINTVDYYDDALRPFVGEKNRWNDEHKGLYMFRIDDRAICPIYFFDPKNKCYEPISYAKKDRKVISTWQFNAARSLVLAKGKAEHNEDDIFAAHDELEAQAEKSANTTQERRKEQRKIENERSKKNVPLITGVKASETAEAATAAKPPSSPSTEKVGPLPTDDALPPRKNFSSRLIGV